MIEPDNTKGGRIKNTTFIASDGRRRNLIQKTEGGAWYLRVTHNGRLVWRSTKTTDLQAAKEKAEQLFQEIVSGKSLDTEVVFWDSVQRLLDSGAGFRTLKMPMICAKQNSVITLLKALNTFAESIVFPSAVIISKSSPGQ